MTPAEKAINFIEQLKYPDGTDFAGEPVKLLLWQKEFLSKLLAVDADGKRIVKECRIWLARGSGKTTLIACLFAYLLFAERNGSLCVTANTIKEAKILFDFTASIIDQHEFLSSNCRIYRGNIDRRIECHYSKSKLVIQSNIPKGKLGGNYSIAAFDEVGFSDDRRIYERIKTSMQKRVKTDTLLITLSTCGEDVEGFGYELFVDTQKMIENPVPHFLGIIYQGEITKWDDIKEWEKANPSLKELANRETCLQMIASAKRNPSEIPGIKRYFMNHWVVGDESPWLDIAKWDALAESALIPSRSKVFVGVDIASVNDFSAVAVLAKVGEKYIAEMYYFTPRDTLNLREMKQKAPFNQWTQQKYLTTVDGDCLDSTCVKDCLAKLRSKYQVMEVAVDRYYNSNDLIIDLQKQGYNVIPIGAGVKTISPTAKEFENLVLQNRLIHNQNPILRWNIINARSYIADENGNVMISKKRSRGKIDGLMALLYALAREMERRNAGAGSISVVKL